MEENERIIEKEIIALEKEEFMGAADYMSDLSEERDKMRKKVRSRRRILYAKKKISYSNMGETLIFKISRKIKEIEKLINSGELSPKQEDRAYRELITLYTAFENITSAFGSSRRMKKMIIRYKDIA